MAKTSEVVIKLVNGELAGKTLQEINKSARDARVELSKAQVGTKEWVAASKKLDEAVKIQRDYKTQIEATSKASGILKQQFGGILNMIPGFSQLSGALSAAKGGVGGLTSGFGILKGAIAATGIGLLVIAITTLVGWFTKTEKGANMLSGAFKAMGAILNTLMDRIWNIGDTLKQLFSDPIEFFKNLGKDIKDAAVEGYELVQVFDDIEDRQRELDVQSKQQENQIDQLLLKSKNVATSYRERIALLDQADKITRDSYNNQLNLSREYLAAVEREVAAAEKQGVMGDELADKLRDAKLKVLGLEGEQISIEEKIQNRRDQIMGKQEKANEKLAADKEKATLKEEKDHEKLLQEKLRMEKEYADALKSIQDLELAAMAEGREKDLAELQVNLERQLMALDMHAPFYAERMRATVEAARFQRDEINKKWDETEKAQAQKTADELLAIEKKKQADNLAAMTGSLQVVGNFFGAVASMQEEGSEQAKKWQYAQAITSAIQGSINAYTSTAAIPLVGPALAPIAAGVALFAGMKAAERIKRQPVPKMNAGTNRGFRTGGFTGDGSPTEAAGIVHKREYVIPEGITMNPAYAGVIGMLENARLSGFQAGGPVNPFEMGRTAASNAGRSGGSQGMPVDFSPVVAEIRSLVAAMDRRIDRLEVVNDLTKTKKGLETLNELKSDADV